MGIQVLAVLVGGLHQIADSLGRGLGRLGGVNRLARPVDALVGNLHGLGGGRGVNGGGMSGRLCRLLLFHGVFVLNVNYLDLVLGLGVFEAQDVPLKVHFLALAVLNRLHLHALAVLGLVNAVVVEHVGGMGFLLDLGVHIDLVELQADVGHRVLRWGE